jgi:hypothetical protein
MLFALTTIRNTQIPSVRIMLRFDALKWVVRICIEPPGFKGAILFSSSKYLFAQTHDFKLEMVSFTVVYYTTNTSLSM